MSSLPTEVDFNADRAATPARMNKAMSYLIARLKAVESLAPGIDSAIATLNTIGLERISAILVPLSEQASASVEGLAALKAMWESDETFDAAIAATTAAVTDAFADYRHRYLGAKAAAPTLRDDGTAVGVGDMYYDTALDQMRVLGVGGWKNAGSSVAGILNQITPIVATAGQTAFTIPGGYDVGYLIVTVNGVVVPAANYTATNGTSITFGSGLSSGDKVAGIAFGAVSFSSVYSKTQADSTFATIASVYTKAAVDTALGAKADSSAVYLKSASDSRYAKTDLSNLTDVVAARGNLGVGVAGTRSDAYFCKSASNLADVADVPTARTNLGLKSGALVVVTVSATAPASPAEGDVWINA